MPPKAGADMIRKVYETNPLICPQCGGHMLITALIEDYKVIDKIIYYLKLVFWAEKPPSLEDNLYFFPKPERLLLLEDKRILER